jgi:hypothetical protein
VSGFFTIAVCCVTCRSIAAADLAASGVQRPLLLTPLANPADTAAALDMQLPVSFSLDLLLQELGEQHVVPVMSVMTQEAVPDMTLSEVWSQMWG